MEDGNDNQRLLNKTTGQNMTDLVSHPRENLKGTDMKIYTLNLSEQRLELLLTRSSPLLESLLAQSGSCTASTDIVAAKQQLRFEELRPMLSSIFEICRDVTSWFPNGAPVRRFVMYGFLYAYLTQYMRYHMNMEERPGWFDPTPEEAEHLFALRNLSHFFFDPNLFIASADDLAYVLSDNGHRMILQRACESCAVSETGRGEMVVTIARMVHIRNGANLYEKRCWRPAHEVSWVRKEEMELVCSSIAAVLRDTRLSGPDTVSLCMAVLYQLLSCIRWVSHVTRLCLEPAKDACIRIADSKISGRNDNNNNNNINSGMHSPTAYNYGELLLKASRARAVLLANKMKEYDPPVQFLADEGEVDLSGADLEYFLHSIRRDPRGIAFCRCTPPEPLAKCQYKQRLKLVQKLEVSLVLLKRLKITISLDDTLSPEFHRIMKLIWQTMELIREYGQVGKDGELIAKASADVSTIGGSAYLSRRKYKEALEMFEVVCVSVLKKDAQIQALTSRDPVVVNSSRQALLTPSSSNSSSSSSSKSSGNNNTDGGDSEGSSSEGSNTNNEGIVQAEIVPIRFSPRKLRIAQNKLRIDGNGATALYGSMRCLHELARFEEAKVRAEVLLRAVPVQIRKEKRDPIGTKDVVIIDGDQKKNKKNMKDDKTKTVDTKTDAKREEEEEEDPVFVDEGEVIGKELLEAFRREARAMLAFMAKDRAEDAVDSNRRNVEQQQQQQVVVERDIDYNGQQKETVDGSKKKRQNQNLSDTIEHMTGSRSSNHTHRSNTAAPAATAAFIPSTSSKTGSIEISNSNAGGDANDGNIRTVKKEHSEGIPPATASRAVNVTECGNDEVEEEKGENNKEKRENDTLVKGKCCIEKKEYIAAAASNIVKGHKEEKKKEEEEKEEIRRELQLTEANGVVAGSISGGDEIVILGTDFPTVHRTDESGSEGRQQQQQQRRHNSTVAERANNKNFDCTSHQGNENENKGEIEKEEEEEEEVAEKEEEDEEEEDPAGYLVMVGMGPSNEIFPEEPSCFTVLRNSWSKQDLLINNRPTQPLILPSMPTPSPNPANPASTGVTTVSSCHHHTHLNDRLDLYMLWVCGELVIYNYADQTIIHVLTLEREKEELLPNNGQPPIVLTDVIHDSNATRSGSQDGDIVDNEDTCSSSPSKRIEKDKEREEEPLELATYDFIDVGSRKGQLDGLLFVGCLTDGSVCVCSLEFLPIGGRSSLLRASRDFETLMPPYPWRESKALSPLYLGAPSWKESVDEALLGATCLACALDHRAQWRVAVNCSSSSSSGSGNRSINSSSGRDDDDRGTIKVYFASNIYTDSRLGPFAFTTSTPKRRLVGHRGPVDALRIVSPSSPLLVSSGGEEMDLEIKVWDAFSPTHDSANSSGASVAVACLYSIPGYRTVVPMLCFAKSMLFSASSLSTSSSISNLSSIAVWKLDDGSRLATLHATAVPYSTPLPRLPSSKAKAMSDTNDGTSFAATEAGVINTAVQQQPQDQPYLMQLISITDTLNVVSAHSNGFINVWSYRQAESDAGALTDRPIQHLFSFQVLRNFDPVLDGFDLFHVPCGIVVGTNSSLTTFSFPPLNPTYSPSSDPLPTEAAAYAMTASAMAASPFGNTAAAVASSGLQGRQFPGLNKSAVLQNCKNCHRWKCNIAKCKGCNVRFCSRQCQVACWREHKQLCDGGKALQQQEAYSSNNNNSSSNHQHAAKKNLSTVSSNT